MVEAEAGAYGQVVALTRAVVQMEFRRMALRRTGLACQGRAGALSFAGRECSNLSAREENGNAGNIRARGHELVCP